MFAHTFSMGAIMLCIVLIVFFILRFFIYKNQCCKDEKSKSGTLVGLVQRFSFLVQSKNRWRDRIFFPKRFCEMCYVAKTTVISNAAYSVF